MNLTDKISIIIPVYNVQEYLPQCIESVLCQTYKNIEVILVDDGSSDKCPQICDIYNEKDTRITVIHKKNCGLSDARNIGLAAATGNYILLVDSDDWLDCVDYVQKLMDSALKNDADIVISNTRSANNPQNLGTLYMPDTDESIVYNRVDAMKCLFYLNPYRFSAWGKLYRKELFEGIEYPKGFLYEDLATTYKLFEKAHKVVYLPNIKYGYRLRKNSIMDKAVKPYLMEMAEKAYDETVKLCPKAKQAAYYCYSRQVYMVATQNWETMNRNEQKKCKNIINVAICRIWNDSQAEKSFKLKILLFSISPILCVNLRKKLTKRK